jgi:hypothetical protein
MPLGCRTVSLPGDFSIQRHALSEKPNVALPAVSVRPAINPQRRIPRPYSHISVSASILVVYAGFVERAPDFGRFFPASIVAKSDGDPLFKDIRLMVIFGNPRAMLGFTTQ